jgi:uracil-DNA glycosylase
MNAKQYRMLQLLNKQISQCELCNLHTNGRCSPFFLEQAQYVILGEAPGRNEVESNMPFIGSAGGHLWSIMTKYNLNRYSFLILNTVNCRPMDGSRNGKPNNEQLLACERWTRKYIRAMQPKAILSLGGYAMGRLTGISEGIIRNNATVFQYENIPVVLSVHPAMCIYNGEKGVIMLEESIQKFQEVVSDE